MGTTGPEWSGFRRNRVFVDFFVRYMRGEQSAKPDVLTTARVNPGEYLYIIDPRTPTPDGDVPWCDVVGYYRTDASGAPLRETFAYNEEHQLVTPAGVPSGMVSDPQLRLAARETEDAKGLV